MTCLPSSDQQGAPDRIRVAGCRDTTRRAKIASMVGDDILNQEVSIAAGIIVTKRAMPTSAHDSKVNGSPMSPRKAQSTSISRTSKRGPLRRIKFWLSAVLAGYLLFLAILTIPAVQTKFVSSLSCVASQNCSLIFPLPMGCDLLFRRSPVYSISIASTSHSRKTWAGRRSTDLHVSRQSLVRPSSKLILDAPAAYKTRNFRLNTSDGESLGAWHVLYVFERI